MVIEDEIKSRYPANRFRPVLLTEVTRMGGGYYCIAGWDVHAQKMVRPLQSSGSNWSSETMHSVLAVGNLINCQPSGRHNSILPHATEDLPLSNQPVLLENLDEPTCYTILKEKAFISIRQLFECCLVEDKYVTEGTHCRSLGGVKATRRRAFFFQDNYGKLRLQLQDSDQTWYRLPVTCNTLLSTFSQSPDSPEPHFGLDEANEWLNVNPLGSEIILRIGLARGWAGKNGDWTPRRCYAQLNGIICRNDNYHIFSGPPSPF